MKIETRYGVLLLAISLVLCGCARTQKVKAMEGTVSVPYESLGTLEVKQQIPQVNADDILWTGVEVVTLTLAPTPSRAERYKKDLRSKLARVARKEYAADALINVTYWPDPSSKGFPKGYLYARGEMIRYQKFPAESKNTPVVQAKL
ncbi:MAG: hypothetical protein NC930_07875 [Candidatus Omnitrophica bacterium]|nr:hypothetical protein [Candidatus Omnitrophota bacterium]